MNAATEPWRGPIVVTGTDTGVGKTVVTAAIAAAAAAAGARVAVVKPAQTGADDDAAEVQRLSDVERPWTLARYPEPLAPAIAADVAGVARLSIATVVDAVASLDGYDVVLIEGAGGLLVPMGEAQWTVAGLAEQLAARAVVVARAGLGTLNHVALTQEALARRGVSHGVVIGAWPDEPALVHRTNRSVLAGRLLGVVPERAAALPVTEFRRAAASWLAPALYGTFVPSMMSRSGS